MGLYNIEEELLAFSESYTNGEKVGKFDSTLDRIKE